ncbi:tetratricopeptide repeat protein [Candidatus Poribacteria bacterium]|nr:tetratricopeptide repeat protein [Candidatus Poribacteria bacterium]
MIFACGALQDQPTIDQYNQFAIKSAELQLWNEAIFRWQHILKIEPQNAKVHNNLGVAYEAAGKIDEAIKAYERATELEPDNKFYRFNYRKCRMQVQRNRVKSPPAEKADPPDQPQPDQDSEQTES